MADVFNFNIGNLSDFTRLFNQVKDNKFLRDTLIKGFPRFWNEFKEQQKSFNTLYGNTINTTKQTPSNIRQTANAIGNKLGQVANTVRASKPVKLITTVAKSPVGKIVGRTAGTVGAAFTEGGQVFNPNNSLKNRIITAAGIGMIPFVPWAGVGTLALANNERRVLQNNQPQAISQKQWEQNILNLNPNSLDPMLKPLNPGEVALFDAWRGNKRLDQELKENQQANQNNGYLGPQVFNQLGSASAPQEGSSNNVAKGNIQQSNQPTLKSTTASSLVTPSLLRGANQLQLDELENLTSGNSNMVMNNNINPTLNQGQINNQSGLNLYAQILGEQRAQQALQQQAIADQYTNLINQYREAADADRRQNQVNNLVNTLGNITPDNRAPIYYVGADGGLNAIEVDQPSKNRMQLPGDTSTNVERFKNIMALQQAQAKARQAAQPDTLNDIRDLMIAQSLGNQYGVDPVTFLNSDYGKVLMQGQNTLQNTRLTGEERRKDIPLNVRGNIIEAQNELANALIRDEANNRAAYERALLSQTSEMQRAKYNADEAMDRLKAQGMISYAQAMDLETLRQNDPLGYLRAAASLTGAVNSAVTPIEGYSTLQNVINSMPQVKNYFNLGGNTQTGMPAVQNGQLTQQGMDIILRNRGR